FGLSLRGIRENPVRMPALGAPSRSHIRTAYTMAAVVAGLAGALLAQTTETVSLGTLAFQRSAELPVILVLGGARLLCGGLRRADVPRRRGRHPPRAGPAREARARADVPDQQPLPAPERARVHRARRVRAARCRRDLVARAGRLSRRGGRGARHPPVPDAGRR